LRQKEYREKNREKLREKDKIYNMKIKADPVRRATRNAKIKQYKLNKKA